MITIIAAINRNRGIGFGNRLIYWLPNDLKRFKALTTGHTLIMGRKTFESLPKGALPNRRNIVLSKNSRAFAGAECFRSMEEALGHCTKEEEIFIIGGASVYAEALAVADRLCLTEIEDSEKEADVFFPAIDRNAWEETARERHSADEKHAYAYSFVDYRRTATASSDGKNPS